MNANDDIRIRANVEHVTDEEAITVIEWCREWAKDCEWEDVDSNELDDFDVPRLLRSCDKYIDGGIAFVLRDVRRLASEGVDTADPGGLRMSSALAGEVAPALGTSEATGERYVVDYLRAQEIANHRRFIERTAAERRVETTTLERGTRVQVVGYRPSVGGQEMPVFYGHVVDVKPSGTVIVAREDAVDGMGNPMRVYVSNGTVSATVPNPIIATHALPFSACGTVLREYKNGMWDAIDGPTFSLSLGFESRAELEAWIASENERERAGIVGDVDPDAEDERQDADDVIARAEVLGAEAGRAAASWYFDGNTTDETYRHVLKGIDDGDPRVMDTFPAAPFSGEFADDMTPARLLDALDMSGDEDYADAAVTAYEDAFHIAAHDEIERVARYMTTEDVDPYLATEESGTDPDADRDEPLLCPECGEPIWDGPSGSTLAKCWNTEGHASGRTLAFDTMSDDEEEDVIEECSECGHLHFNATRGEYEHCPLASEGCPCVMGEPVVVHVVGAGTMPTSEASSQLRDLAAIMHAESVTLWNHAYDAAGGSTCDETERIEVVQRTLSALAWPGTSYEARTDVDRG